MTISLSPETQKLLDEHMKRRGFTTADEAVRAALLVADEVEGEPLEELDGETLDAIERAEQQSARGEGRPVAAVREEFRNRFRQQ